MINKWHVYKSLGSSYPPKYYKIIRWEDSETDKYLVTELRPSSAAEEEYSYQKDVYRKIPFSTLSSWELIEDSNILQRLKLIDNKISLRDGNFGKIRWRN